MNIIKPFAILIAFLLTVTLYGQSVNFEWVRHNAGAEGNITANAITLDANNNIYLAGTFQGDNGVTNIDFDPTDGIAIVDSIGYQDIYIQKLTSAGAFAWVKVVGGTQWDSVTSIQTDSDENLIIVGTFEDTVDFNPGAETYELSSNGESDAYVLKLNADGDFVWAKSFGGSSYDNIQNVVLDAQGNIVVSGTFKETVDFDPQINRADDTFTTGVRIDGSADGTSQVDTYILKYSQSTLDITNPAHQQNMIVYPNPSSGQVTLDFGVVVDKVDIRVLNLFGQVVSEGDYNQVSQLPLAIAGAVGLYWVEVTTDGSKKVFSVIKK